MTLDTFKEKYGTHTIELIVLRSLELAERHQENNELRESLEEALRDLHALLSHRTEETK